VENDENSIHAEDHCATTTTTTTMITTTITLPYKCSTSGSRQAQDLKVEIPPGLAAVPCQAYASGRLIGSGDRKPHLASSMHDVSMEGDVQSPRCERGESVALSTDEVSAQQLDVTLHGFRGGPAIEGDPSGDPVACSPRVSNLGNSRLEEIEGADQSRAASADDTAEDRRAGAAGGKGPGEPRTPEQKRCVQSEE